MAVHLQVDGSICVSRVSAHDFRACGKMGSEVDLCQGTNIRAAKLLKSITNFSFARTFLLLVDWLEGDRDLPRLARRKGG